jgi:hypothetical protein
MADLKNIVRTEVMKYAGSGRGINLRLFPILDDERFIYSVTAIDFPRRKESASVVVLARIVEPYVVIEEDATDKPLIEALVQQGVPREKIILAYQGEAVPDPVPSLV